MTAASCFLLFYLYLYRFSSIVAPFMQIYHATPPLAAQSRFGFGFSFCLFVFRRCRFLETLWRWAILFDRQLMGWQARCWAATRSLQLATAPQKSVNISGILAKSYGLIVHIHMCSAMCNWYTLISLHCSTTTWDTHHLRSRFVMQQRDNSNGLDQRSDQQLASAPKIYFRTFIYICFLRLFYIGVTWLLFMATTTHL